MKKILRLLLPVLALLTVFPALSGASAKPGRGSATFLRVPVGARATALGESEVTGAEDAQMLFWNPAALGPLRTPLLAMDHLFYFDKTRIDSLAVSYPTLWGGVAAGTRWFTGPGLARIRNGVDLGSFDALERTGELAIAFGKRNFTVGFLGRYYQSVVDERKLTTLMGDAGVLKTWKRGRYRVGAVAQNMGSSFGYGSSEDLKAPPPRQWRTGFSAQPFANLIWSVEHQKPQNLSSRYHTGLELWVVPSFALRTGYVLSPQRERNRTDPLADWRFGTGFRIAAVDLDYAYSPAHTLGDAHHVSLQLRFTGLTVLEEAGHLTLGADPSYISPNKDGRKDAAFFVLGTQGLENVSKWLIEVRSAQSQRVWKINGRGAVPGLTEWAGIDQDGKPLPEGDYLVQARVWSPSYQALSTPQHVAIDVTPPQAELTLSTPVFTPGGEAGTSRPQSESGTVPPPREDSFKEGTDAVAFQMKARDKNPLSLWILEIVSQEEPRTTVFSASGTFENGQSTCVWNGSAGPGGETAANGTYDVLFKAEDAAGNVTAIPPAVLKIAANAETLIKKLPPDFHVQKTPAGYKIVLPSEEIFGGKAGVQISTHSQVRRDQILLVAKALPGCKMVINGYAGSEKTPARRKELSSARAWSLYSALVKSGFPATRLEVHGLGGKSNARNRLEILLIKPPQGVPAGSPPEQPAAAEPPKTPAP